MDTIGLQFLCNSLKLGKGLGQRGNPVVPEYLLVVDEGVGLDQERVAGHFSIADDTLKGTGFNLLDEILIAQVVDIVLVGGVVCIGAAHEDVGDITGVKAAGQYRAVIGLQYSNVQGDTGCFLILGDHVVILLCKLGAVEQHIKGDGFILLLLLSCCEKRACNYEKSQQYEQHFFHTFLLFFVPLCKYYGMLYV